MQWRWFFLLCFAFLLGKSQSFIPLDSSVVQDTHRFYLDDYNHLYLYRDKDYSLTKFNDKGQPLSQRMEVYPFKIQQIVNPLNVILFSANQQVFKFLDQNLVEIQQFKIPQHLGYIDAVYIENLQVAWLLNATQNTLTKYNYRDHHILSTTIFKDDINIEEFIIQNGMMYYATPIALIGLDTKTGTTTTYPLNQIKKIRREGNKIFVLTHRAIYELVNHHLKLKISQDNSRIMEKNSNGYLALIGNKVYLYTSF